MSDITVFVARRITESVRAPAAVLNRAAARADPPGGRCEGDRSAARIRRGTETALGVLRAASRT